MIRKRDSSRNDENNLPLSTQGTLNGDDKVDKNDKSVISRYIENTNKTYHEKVTRSKSKTDQKTKKQWLWEFSKKIVVLVAIAFFIVLVYTLVFLVINPDSTAIQFLLDNVSDIFKVTVVSYAIKAGFENVIKIHKYNEDDGEV